MYFIFIKDSFPRFRLSQKFDFFDCVFDYGIFLRIYRLIKHCFQKRQIIVDCSVFNLLLAYQLVFLYFLWPDFFSYLSLTVKTENLSQTLSFVEQKWNELQLGGLFTYFFLDEDFNRHYRSEESLGRLYAALTLLAIFLSCLGLAGLSSFAAEQRTKEIGIRKVLGASVPNILTLLMSEFIKWVMLSSIIAWPVAYFVIHRWLQGFAYRTSPNIWVFGLSAGFALFIAVLTVSYQSVKAAITDPVNSLRHE